MARGGAVAVSREQVIAYRIAAQGLHRDTAPGRKTVPAGKAASPRKTASVHDLAVLRLGVQEAMGHPAALAYAARLPDSADLRSGSPAVGDGHLLAMVWSVRGAPHVHRRADLDSLAGALWPLSEADATARLNETGPSVQRAGIPALEQFGLVVEQMAAAVPAPTAKGAVSTAVTRQVPAVIRRDCRACKTQHVSDSAMRATLLGAGLELEPGTAPPVLLPRAGAHRPQAPDHEALTELARTFATLLGPTDAGMFAHYLEARRADVAEHWPTDLTDVEVQGRPYGLPADHLESLVSAPAPEIVRLLGPFDPYLQARDRELIVPDTAVRKALWPVLGRPGALLVDGEIAGTWRTKATAARLTLTVQAFGPLRPSVWDAVDAEAQRVAQVCDRADVRVVRSD